MKLKGGLWKSSKEFIGQIPDLLVIYNTNSLEGCFPHTPYLLTA